MSDRSAAFAAAYGAASGDVRIAWMLDTFTMALPGAMMPSPRRVK